MDDFSNDINTTGFLAIDGAAVNGILEVSSDDDWFRMELDQYYTYVVEIEADEEASPPANKARLRFMDQTGEQVRRANTDILSVPLSVQPTYSGSHFASVLGGLVGQGGYSLSVILIDDYEGPFNNNFITRSETQFGAIETTGDEDPHTVQLQKGHTYSINVYGSDTTDATLADPFVEVYDEDDNLVGSDDNSGTGNNASFTFTPTRTNFYSFNIKSADGGTGSYILHIPELDDFEDDITTTGALTIGGGPEKGFIFWNEEADWFRVNLNANHTYEFFTAADPDSSRPRVANVQIFDASGERVEFFSTTRQVYTAEYTGIHYISATGLGSGGYLLTGNLIDDYGPIGDPRFTLENRVTGAIESSSDNDGFRVPLAAGVRYEINVVGMDLGGFTLENPEVQLFTDSIEFISLDKDSGAGRNAKLFFTPAEDAFYRIGVVSQDGSTGSYAMTIRAPDDYAANSTTTSELVFNDHIATGNGALELALDIDWHAVELVSGRWYVIDSDVDQIGLRDPNLEYVASANRDNTVLFQAETTGQHYVVTRRELLLGPRPMSYDVSVEHIFPQTTASVMRQMPFDGRSVSGYVSLTTGNSGTDLFEVYANNRLTIGQQSFAPNQLLELTRAEFQQLKVPDYFRGNSQIFVRSKTSASDWSNWDSLPVYGSLVAPEVQGTPTVRGIYYSFATELPSYYDDGTVFRGALSASEQDSVRDALRYWNEQTGVFFLERDPSEINGRNEIAIFKGAVANRHVGGTGPGAAAGYDLLINPFSPLMQGDWNEGEQAFFEILRGIGLSLGVSETDKLNRRETIMGVRSDAETSFMPYPSQPLPLDALAVSKASSSFRIDGQEGDTNYRLGGERFARTIVDESGFDTIDASGEDRIHFIDLRPGATSYSGATNSRQHSYVNSHYSFLESAIGGNFRDVLIGSNLNNENILEGRDGNDTLMGMQGDDLLMGGRHSDTYVYQLGHDNDIIDEQGLAGTDRLLIEGMHNFDSLSDLSFRRAGGDLEIRIDLDMLDDHQADTITIRNMNQSTSRVERLELRSVDEGMFAGVSLISAFQQSSHEFKRFELAAGADRFGSLVQPLS